MNRSRPSTRLGDSLKRRSSAPISSKILKKKRKRRTKNIKKATAGEVKYAIHKPGVFRPYEKHYSKGKPSDYDIRQEMARVAKCATEVEQEAEKQISKEWKKMMKDVEPLKVDKSNIKPFVFTGAKRVLSTPPPRKCKAEVPMMFYYQPLTDSVEAKEEPQLSHVPVIDDNQHDNSILKHLVEHYECGIHGCVLNKFAMSEELLYKTMKKVLPETENPDLLYYALYQTFYNYGNQKEFSKMFPKLHRVYGDGKPSNLEPWKTQQKGKLRKKKEEEIQFGPPNLKPLGKPKKVFVRTSKIAGNGLYLGENVKKDEYIGEYNGEHCSVQETERRKYLSMLTINYAFNIGNHETVDSQHAGNVFRFANDSKDPNLVAVSVGPRIAIHAFKSMKAGTELTLDYGYSESKVDLYFRSRPEDRVPRTPGASKRQGKLASSETI